MSSPPVAEYELSFQQPLVLRLVLSLLGVAALAGSAGLGLYAVLWAPRTEQLLSLSLSLFSLVLAYVLLSRARKAWTGARYLIDVEGSRLRIRQASRARHEVLLSMQLAAITSLGFAFGQAKRRKARKGVLGMIDGAMGSAQTTRARGLLLHYTVMGRTRLQLVTMPALTRGAARRHEAALEQWLMTQAPMIMLTPAEAAPTDELAA